ncbi:hypothetical protein Pcar_2268 [Syntrophotalea carbinolica DSM 2380]|uniref:Uncharacterized protein n=1 Tax=Syntrophotalea carbinolica (strain DSM 2380 / NBRC 103641 / GraBd1) TaxID=338963 RepID=Q3A2A0_SYNC1|nr:hypothetical protein Pcar_2268 [Syntrophotalea carbinolica DSM 2380]
MSHAIDVHVLLLPTTNPVWWSECRHSLRDGPVNLHLVDGVEGYMGRGRTKGFCLGNAPHVGSRRVKLLCVEEKDLSVMRVSGS